MPDVVLTRLLGEAAHRHVLDHAGAQRADGSVGKIAGHRGFLARAEGCWTFAARDRMPRSSPPTAHRLPQAVTRAPARAGSFFGANWKLGFGLPGFWSCPRSGPLEHALASLLRFVCNAKEDERMCGPQRPAETPGECLGEWLFLK